MSRVFANGPGDLGSIPGRIIPKTLKMVLDTSLLNIQQYKVCIESKEDQSSPTPWCSSYWKGSLRVALDYSCQLIYIYSDCYFFTKGHLNPAKSTCGSECFELDQVHPCKPHCIWHKQGNCHWFQAIIIWLFKLAIDPQSLSQKRHKLHVGCYLKDQCKILPSHTHTHTHTHVCMYVCMYVYVV